MEANVPVVAGAVEAVRIAAGRVVPLEYQHALAAMLREQRGGREPADARADDDGVPARVKGELFVGGQGWGTMTGRS